MQIKEVFKTNKDKIKQGVELILEGVGEDTRREGLKDTPERVAKMLNDVLAGIKYTNQDIANMFGKTFECNTRQLVAIKGINCFSYCEHHLALMYDMKIDVGYIPNGKVIGLSKIPRIVNMCCRRLQLQERIGEDIAEVIKLATGSCDIIVKISASHSCVTARGIKARECKTNTLITKGVFNKAKNIQLFLNA